MESLDLSIQKVSEETNSTLYLIRNIPEKILYLFYWLQLPLVESYVKANLTDLLTIFRPVLHNVHFYTN